MARALAVCGLALLAAASPPHEAAAETAVFGAWHATCTDSHCEAATGGGTRLVVEPGETGYFVAVEFSGPSPDPDRRFNLGFPGGPEIVTSPAAAMKQYRGEARLYVVDAAVAGELFAALPDRDRGLLSYIDITGEPRVDAFALAGLSEALGWMADARGAEPPRIGVAASGLPEPAGRSEAEAIRDAGIPEPVLYLHLSRSDCEDPQSTGLADIPALIEPVSDTALLYALPCTAGADNVAYRLYIRERGEIGGVHPQLFAVWSDDYGWSGTDLLYNVEVDGRRLAATFRGRSVTDCGWSGLWTFADYAYRLERFSVQETCGGLNPADWPAVYGGAR